MKNCFDREGGELAYLALTSKPEFVIRDRLAWELHKQLKNKYIVAREWKRVDIAILHKRDKPAPASLIQLKTWSLFTFIDDAENHFKKVRSDVEDKCEKKGKGCSTYALILATHIDQLPDERYEEVVKYRRRSRNKDGWKEYCEKIGSLKRIRKQAVAKIKKQFVDWKVCDRGEIDAGEVFESSKVSVLYWLDSKEKEIIISIFIHRAPPVLVFRAPPPRPQTPVGCLHLSYLSRVA